MLEKVAERYHTTPATVVALNGPDKLIGPRQTLRLPNVVPASRDYSGSYPNAARLMTLLNVDAREPHGSYIVVDKSEGVLKVYSGPVPGEGEVPSYGPLLAQFPVTIGSTHDPLPIGTWKVTTFAFFPPFHYQPNLFWDAKDTAKEHMLAPGPNGPVGVAWLDLSREHYGIHGSPEPSEYRQDRKPRLHPDDQLGRDAAGADHDEAGFPGDLPGIRALAEDRDHRRFLGPGDQHLLGLGLWAAQCRARAERYVSRRPATWRRSSRPRRGPVAIAEGLEVGPAGLAIPVAGVKPRPADRHLHPGAGGRRPPARRD